MPSAAAVPSPAAVPEAPVESTSTPSPTAPAEIGKEFDDLSFLNEEQRQALLELEIPVEDGEVIISRRLSKGRTTSKINGETVPVSMVRKAGTLLIDIHGQHENQSLLHIRKHLELLDDFA